jgi:hypothetical protein
MGQEVPILTPAPFVNEDLTKGENRTNLALLSILLIPEFRYWFLGRLGLTPDCKIYPPQTQPNGRRPDYVAVGADGFVKAWIEVELHGADVAQLQDYQNAFLEPVKCIAGRADSAGADLSLEELAMAISVALDAGLDAQQRTNAAMFVDLVGQLTSPGGPAGYVIPTDSLAEMPLISAIRQVLGERLHLGVPPAAPGQILLTTTSQKGWTLRAYCKDTVEKSVSLLWNPAIGAGTLRVPSREKLLKYFDAAVVEAYADFWLQELQTDIATLGLYQSHAVREADVLWLADRLAGRMKGFIS